ncbi:YebC/PmpR family DNA-binding transcriptional regulator [Spirulina sp. CCNP1310]|uniref:YebC/PmpR family DNA-binding transcriptional regulator n=1 Tax=Spirulina sp. CCNP1310 TaxID=3110249 RepID=UPI002B21C59B|nr:YebC/PmpR family DNA-binding transcriptional regulator [Spirulina sp. CCNP1310]MEA5419320.1 YebC/PmpR family DNA-binding transcriptional regulator [Spirulina sp. CCNP1310]
MAGHSKWANIKRQKARVDAKKGKTFTQLSRAIIVAARNGLPDPDGNMQLRTAIEKAKAAGIPNENIDRAIAKGAGTYEADSANYEAIRYEGYGPGGVAVLIEAFTDNRNRTAADLRVAFGKNGGNLGETGCVSWMFDQKGVVCLAGVIEEETLLEVALEGEAESYEIFADEEEPGAEVFTTITELDALTKTLQAHFTVKEAEWRWIPSTSVAIEDADQGKSLIKLMDALEGLDDVQNVTANFELTDGVLALI